MISLFLNTCSKYLNIAILKDNKVYKEENIYLDKDLSKMALVNIKDLIETSGLNPNDVDEIVCVNGPGSFTGVRIGVTIAKSYAWSLNKKIVPVSNLFAMATSITDCDYIVPIIDARRGYVFGAIYDKNYNPVLEDQYILLDDLNKKVKELNGKIKYVSLDEFDFETDKYIPNINNLFLHLNKEYVDNFSFVPNYLKRTEAEEKLSDRKS